MVESRWLDAAGAAAHLSVSVAVLRRKVRSGVLPEPSRVLGAALPRWDRDALDATMLGSTASPDAERAAEALADKIAVSGRLRRQKAAG